MVNIINLLKNYIPNIIIYFMTNIDYYKFKKINERVVINQSIKNIQNIINNDTKLEKNLFKNIVSFLYGNFIEVTFKDNDNYSFYFFKRDIISSETLLKLFYKFKDNGKAVFKLDIEYNKQFFDIMVNYLIYNDNKDNIGTMIYNNSSWLYLKDEDDFNNDLLFSLNYYELSRFQKYIKFFKIKVLDFKVGIILDIINICNISGIRTKLLNKFI